MVIAEDTGWNGLKSSLHPEVIRLNETDEVGLSQSPDPPKWTDGTPVLCSHGRGFQPTVVLVLQCGQNDVKV